MPLQPEWKFQGIRPWIQEQNDCPHLACCANFSDFVVCCRYGHDPTQTQLLNPTIIQLLDLICLCEPDASGTLWFFRTEGMFFVVFVFLNHFQILVVSLFHGLCRCLTAAVQNIVLRYGNCEVSS